VAVYVVVALVAVALLWAAYRAFGRPASAPAGADELLRRVAATAREAAARLQPQVDAPEPPGADGSARSVRRGLEGCAQLLERVDTATLPAVRLAEHALLLAAVEDLSWAARLREAAGFDTNPGLRSAAASLCAEASGCLDDAAALTVPSEHVG
jgi:hypothetical protein